MSLQVVPSDPGYLLGTISGGAWSAEIFANEAAFDAANPCTNAGNYTLAIPGDPGNDSKPAGCSYGTLKVDKKGALKFAGSLADGTPITESTALSKAGEWPCYIPLYRGQGSLVSWIIFTNQPETDLTGLLSWIKPNSAGAKYYSGGFTDEVLTAGSKYIPRTTGVGALGWINGAVAFTAGNLAQPFTNSVAFTGSNKALNTGGTKMSLNLVLGSGLFKGTVEAPGTTGSAPFQGIVFQKTRTGTGVFLGANEAVPCSLRRAHPDE